MIPKLHKVQMAILYALRRTPAARFSELMRPTGLQSDAFKFHLRKLVTLGYVEKTVIGEYQLTAIGKEFANNLDKRTQRTQRQPKLSAFLVVTKSSPLGEPLYLFQKRLRHPFYEFWGCLSGPIQWGEEPEETAARELYKQTGLTATFEVQAFCRNKDYRQSDETLLEDKLFTILTAKNPQGELHNDWTGGHNAWMTLSELAAQPHHFAITDKILALLAKHQTYLSENVITDTY